VTAGGRTVQGSLLVRKDPRSPATLAALVRQRAFLLRVRGDLIALTHDIERLRSVASKDASKRAAVDALLHDIYNPEVTQDEDALRYPERVYGKLSFLASDVASADAAPTQSEYAVLKVLEREAHAYMARAAAL
jgi:hypothetical protein